MTGLDTGGLERPPWEAMDTHTDVPEAPGPRSYATTNRLLLLLDGRPVTVVEHDALHRAIARHGRRLHGLDHGDGWRRLC